MKIKDKLLLYGAGRRADTILSLLDSEQTDNIILVDSNHVMWGGKKYGVTITGPEVIKDYYNWCITIADKAIRDEIENKCIVEFGLDKDKEISYVELIISLFDHFELGETNKRGKELSILIDCIGGLPLGGIESWSLLLAEHFIKTGKVCEIISRYGEYDIPGKLCDKIIYIKPGNNKYSKETINSIVEKIRDRMPCAVICNRIDECLLAACLLKEKFPKDIRVYSVTHIDQDIQIEGKRDFWNYYDIDAEIGVSKDICCRLIDYGIPKEHVYLMTCPVNVETDLKRQYSMEKDSPIRIGYAGRMDGYKGSQKRMDLIVGLAKELTKRNISYVLELAGDGPIRGEMENDLMLLIQEGSVLFVGRLSDTEVNNFWKSKDIAVNLSDYEGHSISQMEAMACGAVPILTDVSGVKDDVTDGINGFIVPAGEYVEAADKVEYLAKNRRLLPKMGYAAHEEIAGKASWTIHMGFWEEMLS